MVSALFQKLAKKELSEEEKISQTKELVGDIAALLNAKENKLSKDAVWEVTQDKSGNYSIVLTSPAGYFPLNDKGLENFIKVLEKIGIKDNKSCVFTNKKISLPRPPITYNVIGFDIPKDNNITELKTARRRLKAEYTESFNEAFGSKAKGVITPASAKRYFYHPKELEKLTSLEEKSDKEKQELVNQVLQTIANTGYKYLSDTSCSRFDVLGRMTLAFGSGSAIGDTKLQIITDALKHVGLDDEKGVVLTCRKDSDTARLSLILSIEPSYVDVNSLKSKLNLLQTDFSKELGKKIPLTAKKTATATVKKEKKGSVFDGGLKKEDFVTPDENGVFILRPEPDYVEKNAPSVIQKPLEKEDTAPVAPLSQRSKQDLFREKQNMQRLADTLNEALGKYYPNQEWRLENIGDSWNVALVGKENKDNLLPLKKQKEVCKALIAVGIRETFFNTVSAAKYADMVSKKQVYSSAGLDFQVFVTDGKFMPVIRPAPKEAIDKTIANIRELYKLDSIWHLLTTPPVQKESETLAKSNGNKQTNGHLLGIFKNKTR